MGKLGGERQLDEGTVTMRGGGGGRKKVGRGKRRNQVKGDTTKI